MSNRQTNESSEAGESMGQRQLAHTPEEMARAIYESNSFTYAGALAAFGITEDEEGDET